MIQQITISTHGKGLYEVTSEVERIVGNTGVKAGICTLFLTHTSASLLIQENADPSVKTDLEAWFERHIPDNDPLFTHTLEGPDDMPSHIKTALTAISITIPIYDSQLTLGTWQGIYLWEHRRRPHKRTLVVSVIEG